MALNMNITSASASSKAFFGIGSNNNAPKSCVSLSKNNKDLFKLYPSSATGLKPAAAAAQSSDGRVTEEQMVESSATSDDTGVLSSTRTQLDLLEQLTSSSAPSSAVSGYESDSGSTWRGTIREQLAQLVGDRDGDFSIPLGKKNLKKVSPKFLTTSQKRNIRRQAYLNEVSQRNDSVFFATIGAFVLLPPVVILGIAILTGYVQLFP